MPFTLDWFISNLNKATGAFDQATGNRFVPEGPPVSYSTPKSVQNQNRIMRNLSKLGYTQQGHYNDLGEVPRNLLNTYAAQQGTALPFMQHVKPPNSNFIQPQVQQGSGRPPKVPGPRNPVGRQRVPQVPQASQQSARINRMNWIDWADPNKGGGSFR